jgi:hypothetical protein
MDAPPWQVAFGRILRLRGSLAIVRTDRFYQLERAIHGLAICSWPTMDLTKRLV